MRPLAHSTPIYDRFYLLATALVVYVTLAALEQGGSRPAAFAFLVAAPLLLAAVWRATRGASGLVSPEVHPTALLALRSGACGAAVWAAARFGPERAAFEAAANAGVAVAVVAANVALARIPARPGLMRPPRSARALDAAGFCACFWAIAVTLPALRALGSGDSLLFDPVAARAATNVACIASLLVTMAAALRLTRVRRLELGVADRVRGALALSLATMAATLPAALLGWAAASWVLPFGALFGALACAWAAAAPEPAQVSSALRGALIVVVVGAPLGSSAAWLAASWPARAGIVTLAAFGVAIGVGVSARALAKPLSPEEARWLAALRAAGRACLMPEPEAAITATLRSLQELEENVHTRPELWRVEPEQVLQIDVAGYLHAEPGAAPADVYELARGEPERVLRREVLEHLVVKRPDVRGALDWLCSRRAFAAVLVQNQDAPIGLLLVPEGQRTRPLTLDEARAARTLCDRLSAVLEISSALARMQERERAMRAHADELRREVARLSEHVAERERPRDSVLEALAAGVRVAPYSARSRETLEELSRLAAASRDLTLEVPAGVPALGWASVYHLASPRARGQLVVVDGALSATREASYWSAGPDSPAARAGGGTLLVTHLAALSLGAQDALAILLAGRSLRGGLVQPFTLVGTLSESAAALVERRELSRALAQILGPHALKLPALAERREDLRALVLDALCRSGVRRAGQPLGIEPRALAWLSEHDWPGNDAELQNLLERAAHFCTSERVTVADLARAGFAVTGAELASPGTSEPAPPRISEPVLSRTSEPAPSRVPPARSMRAPIGGLEPIAEKHEASRQLRSERRRRRR